MGADRVVEEVGWPFLVAAGRVRDYAVLVAPDFLVASGEQGLLGAVGSAVEGGPVESRSVRTSSGRALTLAYAARLLTPGDLGSGELAEGSSVLDEFGRPLRIVVGMVTDGAPVVDPAVDVARAERSVLPAFRRFWADEAAYRVEPSPGEPVLAFGRFEPLPVEPAPVPMPAPSPAQSRRVRSPALLVVGAVLVLMVVALLLIRPWTSTTECPVTPPTATTTTVRAEGAGSNPVASECK